MNNIIDTLAGKRRMLGKPQSELAEALGVTTVTLGKWELKKSSPTLDNLEKWCAELGYEIKIVDLN